MEVEADFSSKLILLNDEKNFIEKKPGCISFDVNYFKLI